MTKFVFLSVTGMLLICSCKQTVVGPTQTQLSSVTAKPITVTPLVAYTNKRTLFRATLRNDDSLNKTYVWTFYDRSDSIFANNTIYKTFSLPGKYRYILSVFHATKADHGIMFRDTGEIDVYEFSSSIAPSQFITPKDSLCTFQVTPDSFAMPAQYIYHWRIADSSIIVSGSSQLSYRFHNVGVFPLFVEVEDPLRGMVSYAEDVVSVGNANGFLAISPRMGSVGQQVNIRLWRPMLKPGQHSHIMWDYGDGLSGFEPTDVDTVTHVYTRSGKYLLTGRMVDPLDGHLLFRASDTLWIASFPANTLSIAPQGVTLSPGTRQLFTATHPSLDPQHTYHWLWSSPYHPLISRTSNGDTASFYFDWFGADTVALTIWDDALNAPVATSTVSVMILEPESVSTSLLDSMRFVHAYFSGNLIMDGALPGTYGHAFGNTLDYGGSKDSGTSFLRDTLSWPIYAVFNHRHTVCTYLKADVYVYGTIDFHAYVDEWYFGSDIVFIDLPLVRVTSNAIEYGARGSSVKGLAKQITEWGSYDGHVHGSKSCTGVIWDDPTTIPEITLTFSR